MIIKGSVKLVQCSSGPAYTLNTYRMLTNLRVAKVCIVHVFAAVLSKHILVRKVHNNILYEIILKSIIIVYVPTETILQYLYMRK